MSRTTFQPGDARIRRAPARRVPWAGAARLALPFLVLAAGVAAPGRAQAGPPRWTAADVQFLTGMIAHHAQAILMAGWAPTHGASPSVRALCERIVVGQRDEIATMQRWLRDHHQPVPEGDPYGEHMAGMEQPMLMPGMLTAAELAQLDSARGPAFDRLFLAGMIRHHQGAITMVQQLLASPGADQDDFLYKLASDINVDQTTEINRMTLMLDAMTERNRP